MSVFRVVKDRVVLKKNPVDYAKDRVRKLRRNVGACISIYVYVCHEVCLHQHFCSRSMCAILQRYTSCKFQLLLHSLNCNVKTVRPCNNERV